MEPYVGICKIFLDNYNIFVAKYCFQHILMKIILIVHDIECILNR
jgi:hypothetical protein